MLNGIMGVLWKAFILYTYISVYSNQWMEPSEDCHQQLFTPQDTVSLPSAITLMDSHLFISPTSIQPSIHFDDDLSFARRVLQGWKLSLGELQKTAANELVQQRKKDAQMVNRLREELCAVQFDRDKYRSYMEQGQRMIEEHAKVIGRLENQNVDLLSRMKRLQLQGKKERDEERKIVGMLKTKNDHLLHEIKKKEGELTRLKEQLKKGVIDKQIPKNVFQVYHNFAPKTPIKEESVSQKFSFLFQRNQRDLEAATKENVMLREKLGDVREILVEFNSWVDRELFGEKEERGIIFDQGRFNINNHLILNREALTIDLIQLMEQAKDGILQLREVYRGNCSNPRRRESKEEVPMLGGGELSFKKKMPIQGEIKTDRALKKEPIKPKDKNTKTTNKKNRPPSNSQNQTLRSSHDLFSKQHKTQLSSKQSRLHKSTTIAAIKKTTGALASKSSLPSIPKISIKEFETIEMPFEDELSDVSSHDSSILSHVSIEHLGRSRWDILYEEDTE